MEQTLPNEEQIQLPHTERKEEYPPKDHCPDCPAMSISTAIISDTTMPSALLTLVILNASLLFLF
jgi:hypothetical protein